MAWMRSGVRSPSAPLTILVVVIFVIVGCNKSSPSNPAKDAAQREAAGDASASGVSTDGSGPADGGTVSPGSAASSPSCKADDECRTWSSYCREAPCVCRVYAKGEAEPHCSGAGNVTCFVDPCMKKAAACQDGRCVLVMQSNL